MDRTRPHRLPTLSLALLLAAAMTAGGSEGPDPNRREQVPADASPAAVNAGKQGTPSATLRDAVKGRFLIGAAVSSRQLADPKLAELVARQFDCLTADNEFKPMVIHPRPGQFRFEAADRIIDFARAHGMKVVGHTLCWHSQIARRWLFAGDDGKPLPREEALKNLKDHIDAVAGHFKGKVVGWDVVNEAISDRPGRVPARHAGTPRDRRRLHRQGVRVRARGRPRRRAVLQRLRQREPREAQEDAPAGPRAEGRRAFGSTRSACRPTSGLSDADAPGRLERAIAALAGEGVKVVITELDVDVLPRAAGADVATRERGGADPYTGGLPAEVAEAQARFYGRIFQVALKQPGVVTRVTFWGTHDGTSWLNCFPAGRRTNYPLLFDRDLRPKPAFTAVLDALAAP